MTEQTTDKKPLALIIEDDKRQSTVFDHALRIADYDTEVIRDGKEALERLAHIMPAIVLLDMHLPQVSGMDIFKQIRDDSRLERTRIILATADSLMADAVRGDADLVLLKPISFNQLRDLASRLRPHVV